jgi:nitrite reductase/ring-hydroxylating ferredoxin subunit
MRRARYAAATTREVEPDCAKIVRLSGETECALFHHRGTWYATGSICPHQNSSLEGAPAINGEVVCNRHGYRFDLASGECRTIGGYGLPVYSVDIEDETVYVSVWEYD